VFGAEQADEAEGGDKEGEGRIRRLGGREAHFAGDKAAKFFNNGRVLQPREHHKDRGPLEAGGEDGVQGHLHNNGADGDGHAPGDLLETGNQCKNRRFRTTTFSTSSTRF